jgi:hypothetical protein
VRFKLFSQQKKKRQPTNRLADALIYGVLLVHKFFSPQYRPQPKPYTWGSGFVPDRSNRPDGDYTEDSGLVQE